MTTRLLQSPNARSTLRQRATVALAFALLGGAFLFGITQPGHSDVAKPAESEAPTRLREGTKLTDQLGHFKITGDRAIFVTADGTRQFGGLENLNLARVVAAISGNPEDLQWSVSGQVTEFRGSNYLLISHAVIKAKSNPAAKPAGPRDRKPR